MNARKYQISILYMVLVYVALLSADQLENNSALTAPSATVALPLVLDTPKSNPRSRKHMAQSSKKKRTVKQMNDQDLAQLQQKALEDKNYTSAIKVMEQRLKLATDPEVTAQLLYELGVLLFDSGQFEKAIIVFDDFKMRFKGHTNVEEAYYKSVLASYYVTLDAERDQSNTKRAIAHADSYLKAEHNFSKYTQEVASLRKQCFVKKADYEFNVCAFYKKRGAAKSAQQRLAHIQKELLPELPELSPKIAALEQELTMHTIVTIPTEDKESDLATKKKHMQDRF